MKRFIIPALILIGLGVLLYSTQSDARPVTYAALGDSVAAGAGLSSSDRLCLQSPLAYPHIVAQSTGLSLAQYACSGAKVDEGVYGSQKVQSTSIPAQLDRTFASGTPSLISLTIGANDVRWTQFIKQCYYTYCGLKLDSARFATYMADLKLELNILMAKISVRSGGSPPPVIITGYYDPFSYRTCSDTTNLSSKEVTWLKSRVSKLNNLIKTTANKYSYVHYAPVSFAGHELCSSNPWVQGTTGALPFHPTAGGQSTIAKAVLAAHSTPNGPSAQTPSSYRERLVDWYSRRWTSVKSD